jgi:hypothetical protein
MNPQGPTKPAVLTSWKEIALYMGKGVRTVQRWEKDFGLPVRRPQDSDKKAVLARPCDLDAWIGIRCGTRAQMVVHDRQCAEKDAVVVRSCLAAEIETSRMLRISNRTLRADLRSALDQLAVRLRNLQQTSA